VSKKANKVIKNKDVNDSFCKLEVLALNVCGLVSKLRNPDFREFISLYGIICLTETKLDNYDEATARPDPTSDNLHPEILF
jgi:hypothetical protein